MRNANGTADDSTGLLTGISGSDNTGYCAGYGVRDSHPYAWDGGGSQVGTGNLTGFEQLAAGGTLGFGPSCATARGSPLLLRAFNLLDRLRNRVGDQALTERTRVNVVMGPVDLRLVLLGKDRL